MVKLFGKKAVKENKETAKQLEFDFEEVEQQLVELRAAERELKAESARLNSKITTYMEKSKMREYEGTFLRVTAVAPATTSYFDLSEFRAKHPKLYGEFLKTRIQKGYIKVTSL